MNLHNIRMVKRRNSLGFADKALARAAAGCQGRGHDLDGDHPLELGIAGLEHHPHAAAADHFEHFVMIQAAQGARFCRRGQQSQGRVVVGRRLIGPRPGVSRSKM